MRNEPVDVFDRGSVTPVDHSSDTDKAWEFANTLRRLIGGGDIVLGKSTLGAESDRFQAQLDAADLVSGPDVRAVSEALGKGTEAIIEAYNAYDMNKMLTTHVFEGITVAIAPSANDVALSVDQPITGVAVKLAGKVALTYSSIENGQTGNGKVTLSGSAANDVVTMAIKEGSLAESPELTKVTVEGVKTTTGETVKFELLVDVAQAASKSVIDSITASGTIRLARTKATKDSASDQGPTETGKFSLSFGAKFKNTAADAFDLGFAINGDSMGANFNDIWQGIDPGQSTDVKDFSAAISFNAKLAATDDAAKFNLVASRPTKDTTRLALDLAFDVNKIRVSTLISSGEQNSQTVTITNQDKFVMTLTALETEDTITGNIMAADGTTKLADIAKAMNCVEVTMVTGGKFVCLVDAPK